MKKLVLLIMFIAVAINLKGQWECQNPAPTDAKMNDIFFIDSLHGWSVGESLTILYTEDGGATWVEQLNAESNNWFYFSIFHSVCFSDLNNGWAVGHWYMPYGGGFAGIIFHTSDGGETWTQTNNKNSAHCFVDVKFVDDHEGWVIDQAGSVFYTNDAWNSYSVQYSDSTVNFFSLFFLDAYNGWVCGDSGIIIHTENGGSSWSEKYIGTEINIKSLFFVDEDNGWLVGNYNDYPYNATIMYTEDGGNNWEISFNGGNELYEMDEVFFSDENHGWVNTKPIFDGPCLLQTSDGGSTWNYKYFMDFQFYSTQSMFFIDDNNGWINCDNVIMKTIDAGETWQSQNSISNFEFNDVHFTDEETGWSVGYELDINEGSELWRTKLVKTIDGGSNWYPVELEFPPWFEQEDKLEHVFFSDPDHGWLWGAGIFRTSDGGLTWVDYQTCVDDLFFIDSLTGWKSCGTSTYRSIDGGITWTDEYDFEEAQISSVFFINELNGWASGGYNGEALIYNTTDGGLTWQQQFNSSGWYYDAWLSSIFFSDPNHGWAVGYNHTVLHTNDGGVNWAKQANSGSSVLLKSVFFFDNNTGWIVGKDNDNHEPSYSDEYTILYTGNGGEDWEVQVNKPYGGLNSIYFVDQENGWVVGKGGTILHTDNGGMVDVHNPPTLHSSKNLNIKIFPNPTHLSFNIQLSNESSDALSLSIRNINGQEIITMPISESKTEIDISHLPNGIYFVKVWNDKDVMVQKVIKQ